MLWPKGTQGRRTQTCIYSMCKNVGDDPFIMLRPLHIYFWFNISVGLFHWTSFPTGRENQGKLVTSILLGMMIL